MSQPTGIGFGGLIETIRPAVHKLHNSSVSFEEYTHYAAITRADDRSVVPVHIDNVYTVSSLKALKSSLIRPKPWPQGRSERDSTRSSLDRAQPFAISEEEYVQNVRFVQIHGVLTLPYYYRWPWPFSTP